ncbi:hypothetical protein AB0F91_26355 [Amycolatopsis sp. NPDC023774]|uniref:hypothetical protein n=1 Tax=Amycolatopsis sp. NPDC023774 TaxID=3155015 RepID=UPI0033C5DD40
MCYSGGRSPLRPPEVGLELFDERPRAPLCRGSRAEDPVVISARVERGERGLGRAARRGGVGGLRSGGGTA